MRLNPSLKCSMSAFVKKSQSQNDRTRRCATKTPATPLYLVQEKRTLDLGTPSCNSLFLHELAVITDEKKRLPSYRPGIRNCSWVGIGIFTLAIPRKELLVSAGFCSRIGMRVARATFVECMEQPADW